MTLYFHNFGALRIVPPFGMRAQRWCLTLVNRRSEVPVQPGFLRWEKEPD